MKKFDKIFKKRLDGILMDSGLINEEISQHAQAVFGQTGKLVGEVLVEEGYCREEDIARELSRSLQLPYLDLRNYNLSGKLVEEFPAEILHKHQVIPVDRFGGTVTVAMSQHLTPEGYKELQDVANGEVTFYVAVIGQVRDLLDKMAPVEKQKIYELRKQKTEPAEKTEAKPMKPASWTDIFDTMNKNVTRQIPKPAKKETLTGLDLFETLNKKVIEGLKKDEKKDETPEDKKEGPKA